MSNAELGRGLVAIGCQWGTIPEIPSEADALHFLKSAYESGIRFFDTAAKLGLN